MVSIRYKTQGDAVTVTVIEIKYEKQQVYSRCLLYSEQRRIHVSHIHRWFKQVPSVCAQTFIRKTI